MWKSDEYYLEKAIEVSENREPAEIHPLAVFWLTATEK